MSTRYFKRTWTESRGDEFDDWGHTTYYFEIDSEGRALRQLEDYEHGPILKYSLESPEDHHGQLASGVVVDIEADWAEFEISSIEFSRQWDRQRALCQRPSDYQGWQPEPVPDGWFVLPSDRRKAFVAELERELSPQHPLYGLGAVVVATCQGCDEILVHAEHKDGPRWSLVHLTWSGSRERHRGPSPPSTTHPCPRPPCVTTQRTSPADPSSIGRNERRRVGSVQAPGSRRSASATNRSTRPSGNGSSAKNCSMTVAESSASEASAIVPLPKPGPTSSSSRSIDSGVLANVTR